jgi:hypothetical protein
MKIAVLLSGRIKSGYRDINMAQLKALKEKYDVTFFLSLNQKVHDEEYTRTFCKELDIPPENVRVEETKEPEELYKFKKKPETNYHTTYSMFYHNKKCFEMAMASKIPFTVYMKYRADIELKDDTIEITDDVEDNTVYIPACNGYGGVNDQVAYGNFDSMKTYCFLVDRILEYCKSGVTFHPETFVTHHLKKSDLKIIYLKWLYTIRR